MEYGSEVLDPDGARERLEAWKGRIDQLAASTKAMSDRLQELRVTATDRDGMAEVTVDSTGALVDLRLGPLIHRVAPDVVAGTIMQTIREAKAMVAERAQQIIEETLGTESPAARTIAERVTERLRASDQPEDGDGDVPGRGRWGW